MKKAKIFSLLVLTLAISSVTAYAGTSMLKEIKAYQKDVKFTLNGQEVMKDKNAIVYDDTVYVPIRAVSETLGVDVTYKNNTVMISDKQQPTVTPQTTVTPEIPVIQNNLIDEVLQLGKVVEVTNEYVTILPLTLEDNVMNYVQLNVDKNTKMRDKINVGDKVEVLKAMATTKSIPAQSYAYEINVLQHEDESQSRTLYTYEGTIMDINNEKQNFYFDGSGISLNDSVKSTIFVTKDTVIQNSRMDKRIYGFDDLEKEQKIQVKARFDVEKGMLIAEKIILK